MRQRLRHEPLAAERGGEPAREGPRCERAGEGGRGRPPQRPAVLRRAAAEQGCHPFEIVVRPVGVCKEQRSAEQKDEHHGIACRVSLSDQSYGKNLSRSRRPCVARAKAGSKYGCTTPNSLSAVHRLKGADSREAMKSAAYHLKMCEAQSVEPSCRSPRCASRRNCV